MKSEMKQTEGEQHMRKEAQTCKVVSRLNFVGNLSHGHASFSHRKRGFPPAPTRERINAVFVRE